MNKLLLWKLKTQWNTSKIKQKHCRIHIHALESKYLVTLIALCHSIQLYSTSKQIMFLWNIKITGNVTSYSSKVGTLRDWGNLVSPDLFQNFSLLHQVIECSFYWILLWHSSAFKTSEGIIDGKIKMLTVDIYLKLRFLNSGIDKTKKW